MSFMNRQKPDKLRMLVVEDNADTRRLLKFLLRNYEVAMATSSQEALDELSRGAFDVVLMDINLGEELNGEDILRRLREAPRGSDVPVVAVTAYAMHGDREHFLKAGFNSYLAKPFTKQQLMEALQEVLGERALQ